MVQNSTKLAIFRCFCLFELALWLRMKTQKQQKFFNSLKKLYFFIYLSSERLYLHIQEKIISTVWSSTRPKQTNFPKLLLHATLVYLSRWNFLEVFHLNNQFRLMKIVPTHLFATEIKFWKFSVVSVFLNWLYSSEQNTGNAESF